MRKCFLALIALFLALLAGSAAFVYSGVYNVAADDPHWRPVFWLMQETRARSIAVRSADVTPPPLDDPKLVLKGAGQYAAMCVSCHLAPGRTSSELRQGLYPLPPDLTVEKVDPRRAFWVIKHGVKMSAMPAWGATHDDATIWSMVAFLQTLPKLSPEQYRDMVSRAPPDEDMDMAPTPGKPPHHVHSHPH